MKNITLTPKEQDIYTAKICPYCNSKTQLVSEREIHGIAYTNGRQYISCRNFPKCHSYIATDSHGIALGRLAGPDLRKEKSKLFNITYRITHAKILPKNLMYQMLGEYLEIPRNFVNINFFKADTCRQAYDYLSKIMRDHYAELENKENKK